MNWFARLLIWIAACAVGVVVFVRCASGPPLPPLRDPGGDPTAPPPAIDIHNPYEMAADGGAR